KGGDVVLQVGKAEFHVTKQYLATLSPFFNALFFGEFSEAGKEKIELKEVEPQHFAEYLRVVYPCHKKVKGKLTSTVKSLLELARRYETQSVRALCEEYLCSKESCKEFGFKEKLKFADDYDLRQLKVTVMKRLCTKSAINKVMENPSGLQSETLEMICRKSTMLTEMEAAGASAMDVDSDRE
ncbi:CRE-BATH-38 protein, partial [Aphelenchoides avenae]